MSVAVGASRPIKVVLVDDHTLMRDGIRSLLATVPDITLVGEGHAGGAAVALARRHRPDVVLLDVERPGEDRPEIMVPRILAACPRTRVVLLSGDPKPLTVASLMATEGVRGYLVKDIAAEQLFGSIRAVMRDDGRTVIGSSVIALQDAINALRNMDQAPSLTDREREVLELAAHDVPVHDIAQILFLSVPTVRRYLHSAQLALRARTRSGAILRALAADLITLNGTLTHLHVPSSRMSTDVPAES